MKKIGSAFENFAFKAFDFSGRATLLEYWLLLPLIWALIIFLAYGDAVEFWHMLLRREVPPLNPLYWDSIVVFFLTIIPRLSLTVRRLHDSGKSGKWAKLPFLTIGFGIYLVVGLAFALAAMNDTAQGLGMMVLVASLFGSGLDLSAEDLWNGLFLAATAINAVGFDVIFQAISSMLPDTGNVSGAALAEGASRDPTLVLMVLIHIGLPFITFFLHVFFMISPTKPDHEIGSATPMTGASLRRKGEVSDNPFAGYKYLYAKSPEQEAAHKEAAKAEIKSLYQQRVLGQQ